MTKGISLIICCFNSILVIKDTLEAIAKNVFDSNINFEIIIVDNSSTDGTSNLVSDFWEQLNSPFNLRIVYEETPGLINARKKGVEEALFDILIFCDDDNRLANNYIQIAFDIMIANPVIGACGGIGIPDFGASRAPDWWTNKIAEGYAVGKQGNNTEGKIEDNRLFLFGAGLVVRKEILQSIFNDDIHLLLTGRNGNRTLAGDDSEISFYILLLGYELWYSENLKFKHFLIERRLNTEYLYKMYEGFGRSLYILQIYYTHLEQTPLYKKKIGKYFFVLFIYLFYVFVKCKIKAIFRPDFKLLSHMFKYACFEHIQSYKEFNRIAKTIENNVKHIINKNRTE